MEIGNMENFMAQQAGKVKQRQDEMKKIKKGIYQTQVMMEAKAMEDFEKECKKAGNGTAGTAKENDAKTNAEKNETAKENGRSALWENKGEKKTDAYGEYLKFAGQGFKGL